MREQKPMTVGAVARASGLTIRTLHHYDELGLVEPNSRSNAGYRLYGQAEVERLQEVLFFRELGFGLARIKEILDDPRYDRTAALVSQREMLTARADRLLTMIEAVDVAIEARRNGMSLTKEEMLEVFGDHDPTEFEEEVEERWGGTDAYAESAKRTKGYTKADWKTIQAQADEINQAFLALMGQGVSADSDSAVEVAERHRAHISKWFYPCSIAIHAGLGEMYVMDARFTANIDKAGEGLAQYMSRAIAANAARS